MRTTQNTFLDQFASKDPLKKMYAYLKQHTALGVHVGLEVLGLALPCSSLIKDWKKD